jgi:hypothetical protein
MIERNLVVIFRRKKKGNNLVRLVLHQTVSSDAEYGDEWQKGSAQDSPP